MHARRLVAGLVAAATVLALAAVPTTAQQGDPPPTDPEDLVAVDGGIEADGRVEGEKRTSRSAAETDPELLARTDGTVLPVVIKLDYDAIATYGGDRPGLAATSPEETGRELTTADVTTSAYARQVARDEADIVSAIEAAVPEVEVRDSLRVVYGGVTATVPANRVDDLLDVPGVLAVHEDTLRQPLTDSTPGLIGADDVWADQSGQATAGNGVIFASLDSGLWPEHPQLQPNGATGTPPERPGGGSRPCDFGDNPLTPASDVFVCNDKLIGGRAFLDTYTVLAGPEVYSTARDSNGHGTHTATTVAGNRVEHAISQGIDRGTISGVAPGAWVLGYKVCGAQGCYASDSVAAVAQAILDGADVINFSIGGGSNPGSDPVELAFLDAYAAGIFVATSAGNSGPTADTAEHLSPWVTTVAATSPNRDWASTLTLTPSSGPAVTFPGISITAGISTPRSVVLASAPPYSDALCTTPAPPGLFTGKIVVCQRGGGRVLKGFNVQQGGAAGMILYNATPLDLFADNHWLPTIAVQGTDVAALVGSDPGVTGTFTPGTAAPSTPDDLATFSSRGPGLLSVKPDLAAPGEQTLAGFTPTPEEPSGGPPGESYAALSGTSMAAPHVAGSAALVMAAHPDWTPGQVRSALTGSASPTVTVGGAPATPFEGGSGRVQVDAAVEPGLVLDETAERFATLGLDPANAVHLNIASIAVPSLPGVQQTVRTVTNPGPAATYTVGTTADAGTTITVTPSSFTLATGESQEVAVRIESSAAVGTSGFGAITFTAPGRADTRLPVSFTVAESELTVTGLGCTPDPITVPETSTCSFEVGNEGMTDGLVDLRASGDAEVTVTGATLGATTAGGVASVDDVAVTGGQPGVPTVALGTVAGFVPLGSFGGTTTVATGDEGSIVFNVPPFVYGGRTYTRIGMVSNGYLIPLAPGETVELADVVCCSITEIGDAARPNNVLAPFWTDLTGKGTDGAPDPAGFRLNILTDGVGDWVVAEFALNDWGTNTTRRFQVWLGLNGVEDVTFAYDLPTVAALPSGQDLVVGAENVLGQGVGLPLNTLPPGHLRVTSGPATPAGVVRWDVTVQGTAAGTGDVRVEATSNAHAGTVTAVEQVAVEAEPLPVVTDDPDDLSVDALDPATFSAAATGGTLARWERKAPGGDWETVAGATTSPLSFTAHGSDDGSQYRAVFVNSSGVGEATTEPATLTVTRLATTTAVSVAPTDPGAGQDVTFTADIGPATATGTVQFTLDGNTVGGPVAVTGGQAVSPAVSYLPAGPHTVTATYSGDDDHLGSDDATDFTVARLPSSTTIIEVTGGVIGPDTPVDVTVRVVPVPEGGSVQLSLDGTPVGDPLVLDADGEVTATLPGPLAPGAHTIGAAFSGDDDLEPSTDEAGITVLPAGEAFVRRAYQVVLGRNGDAGGVAYWTARIDGGLPRSALVDHLARSTEGRQRLVARTYELALDRTSTAADRDYWVGRLAQGMTPEDLLATFLATHEAIVNAGGTPEGWADKLFDVHLERAPSDAEVTYWAGRAAATQSSAQVRQLAKTFGRVPEVTVETVHRSLWLVCGIPSFPTFSHYESVTEAWVASARSPLVLDGTNLADVCPSSSAPPG